MIEEIVPLNAPDRRPVVRATPTLFLGRKYPLVTHVPIKEAHGLCGGFVCTEESGGPKLLGEKDAFLWDSSGEIGQKNIALVNNKGAEIYIDANTPIGSNYFVLMHSTLTTPEIFDDEEVPRLSFQVEFDFAYSAEAMSARLGILNLVEKQCFVTLENGQRRMLQSSGDEEKILFVNNDELVYPVNTLMDLSHKDKLVQKKHMETISHDIPSQIDGINVETLTVLEQYQSFFMQRELPFSMENIWTPVCAPISWGWSMRVAKRPDGVWRIYRQKLLMPTVGHDGLEMPVWEGNNLQAQED